MLKFEDFKKLNLVIAEILQVEDHPNADKLYIVEVDTGLTKKKVVAGIKPFYSKEELVGKKVVMLENLELATIRGAESAGMILATKNEGALTLLVPEKDIKTGSPVS